MQFIENGDDMDITGRMAGDGVSSASAVVEPGYNVWNIAKAEEVAFLIDGSAYFSALDAALRTARHTIWIVGWDFNPDIRLRPRVSSETLGDLLLNLVDHRPDLKVRILVWGMGPVYSGKSLKMFRASTLSSHPQVTLCFDLRHPIRGCHHQKLVAIDDELGFLGGVDLTARRWDEPDHRVDNAFRLAPDGRPYAPVHDIQAMVSGEAARLIGDVARRRWRRATGEQPVDPPRQGVRSWPQSIRADLRGATAGVALTEPGIFGKRGRHEAIKLTRDAIRSAKTSIYIETQYLASFGVARRLARRLKEASGPEIIVLVTKSSHGWIEKLTMGGNRDRVIRRLKRMDQHDKLRILYPVVPGPTGGEQEINIHSKVMIIDDRFVRIGSSNLNNRSEGLDTECDLAIEAGKDCDRHAIAALRSRLLAEHLDTTPQAFDRIHLQTRSLVKALDTLNTRPRGLREFDVDLTHGGVHPIPGTSLVDPQVPFHPLRRLRSLFALLRWRIAAIF
jgi:phosphatidylserine/phosphatidylglycerophosphate/cardiolipin synthase-like enzyme